MRKYIVVHNEENKPVVLYIDTIMGIIKQKYRFDDAEDAKDCSSIMLPNWGSFIVRETIGEVMKRLKEADAESEDKE